MHKQTSVDCKNGIASDKKNIFMIWHVYHANLDGMDDLPVNKGISALSNPLKGNWT